jgi:hypothetical protein
LGADVEIEFDIVLCNCVSAFGFCKVTPHERADGAGGADSGGFCAFEVFFDVHFLLL